MLQVTNAKLEKGDGITDAERHKLSEDLADELLRIL